MVNCRLKHKHKQSMHILYTVNRLIGVWSRRMFVDMHDDFSMARRWHASRTPKRTLVHTANGAFLTYHDDDDDGTRAVACERVCGTIEHHYTYIVDGAIKHAPARTYIEHVPSAPRAHILSAPRIQQPSMHYTHTPTHTSRTLWTGDDISH